VLAVLGGYLTSSSAATFLSVVLAIWVGLSKADFALWATMLAFIAYLVIVILVFAIRSLARASILLLGFTAAQFGLASLMMQVPDGD
jgi:hypothetical protein